MIPPFLETVPTIRDDRERQLMAIPGMVPENYDDIAGCRFADRCPYRREACDNPQELYPPKQLHDLCLNGHIQRRCRLVGDQKFRIAGRLLGRGGAVKDGSVLFENKNLLTMTEKELDTVRGDALTMIFQDPLTSLNPVFTVGSQITESRGPRGN